MFFSELIGQAVTFCGADYTVGDAVFDSTGATVAQIILFDEDGEYGVSAGDVSSWDPFRFRTEATFTEILPRNNPIRNELLTESGKKLGVIRDLELKGAAVKRVILSRILPLGKACLLSDGAYTVFVRGGKSGAAFHEISVQTARTEEPEENEEPNSAESSASFAQPSDVRQAVREASGETENDSPVDAETAASMQSAGSANLNQTDSADPNFRASTQDAPIETADSTACGASVEYTDVDERENTAVHETTAGTADIATQEVTEAPESAEVTDGAHDETENGCDAAHAENTYSSDSETVAQSDSNLLTQDSASITSDDQSNSSETVENRNAGTPEEECFSSVDMLEPLRSNGHLTEARAQVTPVSPNPASLRAARILRARQTVEPEQRAEDPRVLSLSGSERDFWQNILPDANVSEPKIVHRESRTAGDSRGTDTAGFSGTKIYSESAEAVSQSHSSTKPETLASKQSRSVTLHTSVTASPLSEEHALTAEDTPFNQSTATILPEPKQIPARIIADYAFLLGRIVTSDVTISGQTLIPKGELILARTVDAAFRHAKLFDLTVKSRS